MAPLWRAKLKVEQILAPLAPLVLLDRL